MPLISQTYIKFHAGCLDVSSLKHYFADELPSSTAVLDIAEATKPAATI
jgi:hypothetical protein